MKALAALLLVLYLPAVGGAPNTPWTLVRSPHFEVYSQAGERNGRAALLWFEQLRAFFAQSGLTNQDIPRIIGFRSPAEYSAFRLHPAADAYFIGGDGMDTIVMPKLASQEFGIAAHEYAHLALRSVGLQPPTWLSEGIAEIFSTVRIGEQGCSIGGDLPMRMLTLRQRRWIPLEQLFAYTHAPTEREEADIFYSESWALTHMLLFSPAYGGRFNQLLRADVGIYGKPLSAIMADLRLWIQQPKRSVPLPGVSPSGAAANPQSFQVSTLTDFESRRLLADLLFASSEWDRAQIAYQALAAERPEDAEIAAALGNIALREDNRAGARDYWKRAIQLGIRDARLCYQYGILAEDASLPAEEIVAALRRAIELKPDFDDARYKLGLLENNLGQHASALQQLRAMRFVPPSRAFTYWTAVASALTETDHREEAKEAAAQAMRYAGTAEERTSASRLAYVAATDLTVQMSRDANGNMQMVTARKPHGSREWNPFIEPSDQIVSLEGQIRKVECKAGQVTGFRIAGASGTVEVTLPDPTHVLISGGTPEFVCGAEDGRKVSIQYAKRFAKPGILRGMQFQ